ncbi:MAG: RNA-binding domain-containing protein [Bryobacteraceae bacterium]
MIGTNQLQELIASGESLTVEFKSDHRQISDKEIYEEIVSMANTAGGTLLIGVEDSGEVTGAAPRHGTSTDPLRLQAAIFGNTVPSINTRVSVLKMEGSEVLAVEVDRYPEPCATASGKSLRRIIGGDGKPQSVPFYPRDQRSMRIDLGLLDFSAQPVESAAFEDLDPLEFERLRQAVARLRGDASLKILSDSELAKALRLVETTERGLTPNVAGLLLLGRPDVIRRLLPTHGAFFQVFDATGNVVADDTPFESAAPLLRMFSEIELRFAACNREREVPVGLIRLPIPDYAPESFREAMSNALLHRDFGRMGAVYLQLHPDHLLITNPGGFPEGITLQNILVHEPKPRNPRLAEAFKRIGLVEQTGRGVDRIFLGQLRFGRPAPDYARSDSSGVRVVLRGGDASLEFAAYVFEEDRAGRPLSLDELLALNQLFHERRIDSDTAGRLLQKGAADGHAVLERLQERGLLEAKGEKRGRVYHLSAAMYRQLGQPAGYIRAHGISAIRQEAMVLEYVTAHGRIERAQVMELCGLTSSQAGRLLTRLCAAGRLRRQGTPPRWTHYVAAEGAE